MTPGKPPATELARNAVTFSFCQAARLSATAMAILVSNFTRPSWPGRPGPVLNAGAASIGENGKVAGDTATGDWAHYWRAADEPLEAMHAHFERHVYHRHSHETYSL